jgi:tripartite-type tricarboxylate transporter receptor subunit TctC
MRVHRKIQPTVAAVGIVALAFLPVLGAHAQDYPTRPVEIVAPTPPGGGQDLMMRSLAAVANKYLGQPLVPVNRTGGAGAIGVTFVAQSKPDGYTILINTPAAMIAKPLAEKLAYSSDSFVTIGRLTTTPEIIAVPANAPWKSLKEFVADAKKNPGKFKFSSGGAYNPEHLLFSAIGEKIGIDLIHVPTDGGGPAMTMLLGGHVDISCFYLPVLRAHVASGRLRPLAVNGAQRLKYEGFENVPTIQEELGFTPDLSWWFGIFAPKDTPEPVVQKLRSVVKQSTDDPEFVKRMAEMGFGVDYLSGDEFRAQIKQQEKSFLALLEVIKKK